MYVHVLVTIIDVDIINCIHTERERVLLLFIFLFLFQFTDNLDATSTDDSELQLNVTLQNVLDSLKDNFHLSKADISSVISETSEYSQAIKVPR